MYSASHLSATILSILTDRMGLAISSGFYTAKYHKESHVRYTKWRIEMNTTSGIPYLSVMMFQILYDQIQNIAAYFLDGNLFGIGVCTVEQSNTLIMQLVMKSSVSFVGVVFISPQRLVLPLYRPANLRSGL